MTASYLLCTAQVHVGGDYHASPDVWVCMAARIFFFLLSGSCLLPWSPQTDLC